MTSFSEQPLSRRHLLRGLGVALGLPLLDAMLPRGWGATSTFQPLDRSAATQPPATPRPT